ncbi:MAG: MarR family transcriptional regulator [Actinomycetota bacterium]
MYFKNLKICNILKKNLVLNYIKENPNTTVTRIAKNFNLSRQSVNCLAQKLLRENLIIVSGHGTSTKKGGRRPKIFKFNPEVKENHKRLKLNIDIYIQKNRQILDFIAITGHGLYFSTTSARGGRVKFREQGLPCRGIFRE